MCGAKTTRQGTASTGYVEPPFPQLKVGGFGRQAARQAQNVDTSTLGFEERGARQMHYAVAAVIMSQCRAALGGGTFCPVTVRIRCVWWIIGVIMLTCVRAFKRALVHAHASNKTHNQMTMCAYTEPRDTRRTTAGQARGQPKRPPRDNPRDSPWDNRGTTRGTATGQPKRAPARFPPAVAFRGRGTGTTGYNWS